MATAEAYFEVGSGSCRRRFSDSIKVPIFNDLTERNGEFERIIKTQERFLISRVPAMSTTILGDSMAKSAPESQSTTIKISSAQVEVEFVKCECCGLTEECTLDYISRVRERYQGRWICGLCAEAVKDEIFRSDRLINAEEALNRHMNFCKKFRYSNPPTNPTEHLISAMKQIFRKSLDSPRAVK
ncbi:uncharacterized protein LOC122655037 [Telopea speciosissima]|uniref:uncharacterized protein LOC122655037 n=1 Tax=Telopea speciosissima TaxID=54955 RepID=UPI001CC4EC35|nr:uncharacterized protein LOC122655037 [Telopea speciosissima]